MIIDVLLYTFAMFFTAMFFMNLIIDIVNNLRAYNTTTTEYVKDEVVKAVTRVVFLLIASILWSIIIVM